MITQRWVISLGDTERSMSDILRADCNEEFVEYF